MITLFNKTHEQRTARASRLSRGRRARPLAVESVEGRLMLAATWLEFAPSNIPAAQYHLSFDSVSSNSIQQIQTGSLNQGGFIPPVLSNADVTGNFVLSNDADLFSGGTPVTTEGSPFIGRWFDFGGLNAATGNLRLAVIPIADGGSSLQPNLDSVFAGSPRQGAPASEGGAIPIVDLLPGAGGPTAGDRRMMVADNGDELIHLTRLAKEARDLSARTIQLAAAERPAPLKISLDETAPRLAPPLHATSISGEWARAMVFELAGGEPVEVSRPALGDQSRVNVSHDDDAPTNDDTSLSNIRAHSATEQRVAYPERPTQAAAIELDRRDQRINESVALPHSAVGQLNAFARGQNWQNSHSDLASLALTTLIAAHTLAPAVPGSVNNSPPNSAGSASLMELEKSETTAIRSLADDNVWGPPEIAPLVMVLALEQARAVSVRRAKKHASTLAWPPRRFAKTPSDAV